jgi:hypothetical protein
MIFVNAQCKKWHVLLWQVIAKNYMLSRVPTHVYLWCVARQRKSDWNASSMEFKPTLNYWNWNLHCRETHSGAVNYSHLSNSKILNCQCSRCKRPYSSKNKFMLCRSRNANLHWKIFHSVFSILSQCIFEKCTIWTIMFRKIWDLQWASIDRCKYFKKSSCFTKALLEKQIADYVIFNVFK